MSLLRTAARVGVATSVHGRVQRRQADRWARQGPVAAAPPVPADPPTDAPAASLDAPARLDQLRELGELRSAGVLTEAEFAAEKARVLSS